MSKTLLATLLWVLATLPMPLLGAATDDEIAARRNAEQLAGAFANDGFKKRDGCWLGKLEEKKGHLIQVNLYAGNQYWFSLGSTPGAKKVTLSLHDEAGEPLPVEPFEEETRWAIGFAPRVSGPYYLKVQVEEGTPSSFCLVYSYK